MASDPFSRDNTYLDLTKRIQDAGSTLSPAYLHGSAAGVLAAGQRPSESEWSHWACHQVGVSTADHKGLGLALEALFLLTLAELEDDNFTFQLLLPEDESALADRLQALGQWTDAFISAFGAGGAVTAGDDIPTIINEALQDLADIAGLDAANTDPEDASEEDYTAVAEHVRISCLMIFLEFNQPPATDRRDSTVH